MTNDSSRPIAISFQEYRDEEIVDFFANENRTFHPEGTGDDFGRNRLVGAPHYPGKHGSSKQKGTAAFRVSFPENEWEAASSRSPATGVLKEKTDETAPASREIFTEIIEAAPEVLAATLHEAPKKKERRPEPVFDKNPRPLASVIGGRNVKLKLAAAVLEDPLAGQDETGKSKSLPTHNRPILIARLEDAILPMSGAAKSQLSNRPILASTSTENAGDRESPDTPATEAATEVTTEPLSPEKRLLEQLRKTDRQLGRLIESWPLLSDRLKETITALIDVAEKDETGETPASAPLG